jgi:hypothetical protein
MDHHRIPRQTDCRLHEARWRLANCHRGASRDDLRRLLEEVIDEYEAMEWLVDNLLTLLARNTRAGQDPLVDRLLCAYAGPTAN